MNKILISSSFIFLSLELLSKLIQAENLVASERF